MSTLSSRPTAEPEPPAAGTAAPAERRRDRRTSGWLLLACLLIYNANLRTIGAGDTMPARYMPFGIWRHGTVLFDSMRATTEERHPKHYWILLGRNRHLVSLYPIVVPLAVAPLYGPAVAILQARGWTERRLQRLASVMEKLAATVVAATAVALFYLLLRRRGPPRLALWLTVAFAFGTNTWMIGSQALWQHGIAELMLVGLLLLLTGPCTAGRAAAVGALCGLLVANRPPDVILAAAMGLYGVWWAGRRTPWLIAGGAVPIALVLTYNLVWVGSFFGGYALIPRETVFHHHELVKGIAGLLVSPTRGLLVFSPFLLLLPVAFWRGWRDPRTRLLTLAIGAAVAGQVVLYAKTDWRAGASWGPRFLTAVLPLLVWLLPPAVAALRSVAGRVAFAAAVVASIAIQVVGAFWYTGVADRLIVAGVPGHGEMYAAFQLENTPFFVELGHPPARPDAAFAFWDWRNGPYGNIDRVLAGGRPLPAGGAGAGAAVTAGTPLTLEGWALVDGYPPASLEVDVDDRPAAATAVFFDRSRAAVDRRPKEPTDAGWRAVLLTDGLEPGRHLITVAALGSGRVVFMPVAEREFAVAAREPERAAPSVGMGAGTTVGGDLGAAAAVAATRLRARQQPEGFWLTAHTHGLGFVDPTLAMDPFLTAVMIDLLGPVAGEAGLADNVAAARLHLARQIEPSGLVRHHGPSTGAVAAALGCSIAADADDTALAWRLSRGLAGGGGGARLARALAVMAQYRTGDGLYRTWLAPPEEYQSLCLSPGVDPDPADVGIQMDVYLLLAQADPPAARRLCGALSAAAAEDRLWVYYQQTPLVPLLRQADVRQAGCPLQLPEARLHTKVNGQQPWLAAASLLDRLRGGGAGGAGAVTAAEVSAVLRRLARRDFAAVRETPPLLYHNDLTAPPPVRRYHWSEDFGYALWLRLYTESAHRLGGAALAAAASR